MKRIASIAVGTMIAVVVSFAGSARASSDPKRAAAALIDEGNEHLRAGRYQAALARYEAAHEMYPTPKIFYNMAEASAEVGQTVKAVEYFERFLAESGVPKKSRLRRAAKKRIAELSKKLSLLFVRSKTVGATVYVDGKKVGATPLDRLRLLPGKYEIVVDKPGYAQHTSAIRLEAAEEGTVLVVLTPLGAPPPAPPPPPVAAAPPPPIAAPPPPIAVAPPPPPPPPPPVETVELAPTIPEPRPADEPEATGWMWPVVIAVGAAVVIAGGVVLLTRPGDTFVLDADLGVSSTQDWEDAN